MAKLSEDIMKAAKRIAAKAKKSNAAPVKGGFVGSISGILVKGSAKKKAVKKTTTVKKAVKKKAVKKTAAKTAKRK